MPRFEQPDQEQDKKFLEDEANRKGYDWKNTFWKPQPSKNGNDVDNVIRLLPARSGSGATYHVKVGKHFVRHSDNDIEAFVCMEETYGMPCPACEARAKIFAEAKAMEKTKGDIHRKKADKYALKRLGVFNVIDRNAQQAFKEGKSDQEPRVMLWESPRTLCWGRIVRNAASGGRTSNLFDKYDASGAVTKPGRDILVRFYPEAEPNSMYEIQYLDPVPLGNEEELTKWYEQIIDLLPEKIAIYQKISYEEARIKTFGTKEERDELKALKQRARDEASAQRSSATAGVSEPAAASDEEEAALAEEEASALGVPEEEAPAPKPAQTPKPATAAQAPKPTPSAAAPAAATPAPSGTATSLADRINSVKARMAAGGKK